ncbi:hypothetical protein BST95_14795 [Halioglobus japonicus]|uniref:Uncharacterized protein n=2 Tax=Halioglobus japonicus TaxID=930805 RepID=A0AAP8MH55_9GAMM|nr:hypothetical protein BST95_14795 [Halioglobus japonicus]PLW87635.1 hypothetical protein C0029_03390 [Halioglobus japonicus]GHD07410.1 hypothetical protein GCM10007052_03190 [Halioglobus japonicus]
MYVFVYTVLILAVGVGNKVILFFSGEYDPRMLAFDFPIIALTYFGLIAVWGRARGRLYFTQKIWKTYILALIMSIVLVPIFDVNVASMIEQFGQVKALLLYSVTIFIMIPYYFGLYLYIASDAWQEKRVG